MRRLFDEFRKKKKAVKINSNTAWRISLHQNRCSLVQSDCISLVVHEVKCRKTQDVSVNLRTEIFLCGVHLVNKRLT